MNENLKTALLLAYLIIGLFFVYMDKASLTEWLAGIAVFHSAIFLFEQREKQKLKKEVNELKDKE